MNQADLQELPDNLPVPSDDGACAHLEGFVLPTISLLSTAGDKVDLSSIGGMVVAYFYPMTGKPDSPPMVGWNEIPGARGCTPQACSFRDHNDELNNLGVKVYGISVQPSEDQKEAADRLHLPFDLLSDADFLLTEALGLPTFEYESRRFIKRITLIVENGKVKKLFYPVFPPNKKVNDVIEWVKAQYA